MQFMSSSFAAAINLPLGDIAFWAIVSGFLTAIFGMFEHTSASRLIEWPFRIGPKVFTRTVEIPPTGLNLGGERKAYGESVYWRTLSSKSCLFIRSPLRFLWMPFDLKGTLEVSGNATSGVIIGRLEIGAVLFSLSVMTLGVVFTGLNLLNQGRSAFVVGCGVAGVAVVLAVGFALGIEWGRTRFSQLIDEVEALARQ